MGHSVSFEGQYMRSFQLWLLTWLQMACETFFLKTVPLLDEGDDVAMILTPQAFHNLDTACDIFNHSNIHFWEWAILKKIDHVLRIYGDQWMFQHIRFAVPVEGCMHAWFKIVSFTFVTTSHGKHWGPLMHSVANQYCLQVYATRGRLPWLHFLHWHKLPRTI